MVGVLALNAVLFLFLLLSIVWQRPKLTFEAVSHTNKRGRSAYSDSLFDRLDQFSPVSPDSWRIYYQECLYCRQLSHFGPPEFVLGVSTKAVAVKICIPLLSLALYDTAIFIRSSAHQCDLVSV